MVPDMVSTHCSIHKEKRINTKSIEDFQSHERKVDQCDLSNLLDQSAGHGRKVFGDGRATDVPMVRLQFQFMPTTSYKVWKPKFFDQRVNRCSLTDSDSYLL